MENDADEFEDLGTRRKAAVTKLTKTVLNHTKIHGLLVVSLMQIKKRLVNIRMQKKLMYN